MRLESSCVVPTGVEHVAVAVNRIHDVRKPPSRHHTHILVMKIITVTVIITSWSNPFLSLFSFSFSFVHHFCCIYIVSFT